MDKKYLLIVASLLIFSGCNKAGIVSNVVNKVENKKAEVKQSLKDLIGSGVSQKCSWKTDDSGNTSEGQMWIAGKKFRQEIKTVLAPDKKESRVVVVSDGKYTYMWNSEMGNKGIKMAIPEDQAQDNNTVENGKVDWNKQFQYECNPAVVSEKDLTPPADVEFQDLGVQLQELQKLQEKYGAPTGSE